MAKYTSRALRALALAAALYGDPGCRRDAEQERAPYQVEFLVPGPGTTHAISDLVYSPRIESERPISNVTDVFLDGSPLQTGFSPARVPGRLPYAVLLDPAVQGFGPGNHVLRARVWNRDGKGYPIESRFTLVPVEGPESRPSGNR